MVTLLSNIEAKWLFGIDAPDGFDFSKLLRVKLFAYFDIQTRDKREFILATGTYKTEKEIDWAQSQCNGIRCERTIIDDVGVERTNSGVELSGHEVYIGDLVFGYRQATRGVDPSEIKNLFFLLYTRQDENLYPDEITTNKVPNRDYLNYLGLISQSVEALKFIDTIDVDDFTFNDIIDSHRLGIHLNIFTNYSNRGNRPIYENHIFTNEIGIILTAVHSTHSRNYAIGYVGKQLLSEEGQLILTPLKTVIEEESKKIDTATGGSGGATKGSRLINFGRY